MAKKKKPKGPPPGTCYLDGMIVGQIGTDLRTAYEAVQRKDRVGVQRALSRAADLVYRLSMGYEDETVSMFLQEFGLEIEMVGASSAEGFFFPKQDLEEGMKVLEGYYDIYSDAVHEACMGEPRKRVRGVADPESPAEIAMKQEIPGVVFDFPEA